MKAIIRESVGYTAVSAFALLIDISIRRLI
jgi:hypothetical protein